MAKGFPVALEKKLLAMTEPLTKYGVQNKFVYKIADLDPAQACMPCYDDSDWAPLENRVMQRDQGVTWIRAKITVPANCEDIPIEGSQLRVSAENGHAYFAPLDIYVDGKLVLTERSWMDCKCPEGIVSQSAVPGAEHTIALRFDLNEKCYWLQNFTLQVLSDRVVEYKMQILSIIEELKYMANFEGADAALDAGTANSCRFAPFAPFLFGEDTRQGFLECLCRGSALPGIFRLLRSGRPYECLRLLFQLHGIIDFRSLRFARIYGLSVLIKNGITGMFVTDLFSITERHVCSDLAVRVGPCFPHSIQSCVGRLRCLGFRIF